jgi:hypothetical protein
MKTSVKKGAAKRAPAKKATAGKAGKPDPKAKAAAKGRKR